ncbi:class I SAM-dependent methyltransferase [Amycolatopsis carbonis]|uniref:class I SAM-dependent methyltransferase n=1 Tax=Amycolatopsis carbonis TaxID=715471 RepID=UPI003340E377
MCLEVGRGTGVHAGVVRELQWTPVGVDLSAGMLRYGRERMPVARADAQRLPVRDGGVDAVVAVMVHTDMPAYPAVLPQGGRVLRPGGVFVHVGVHPCFCSSFADRSDPTAAVIRPGYRERHRTKDSWTDQGIRDKVGRRTGRCQSCSTRSWTRGSGWSGSVRVAFRCRPCCRYGPGFQRRQTDRADIMATCSSTREPSPTRFARSRGCGSPRSFARRGTGTRRSRTWRTSPTASSPVTALLAWPA